MTEILDRHRHAAKIVLESVARVRGKPTAETPYGLGGGNALIAHQISSRAPVAGRRLGVAPGVPLVGV